MHRSLTCRFVRFFCRKNDYLFGEADRETFAHQEKKSVDSFSEKPSQLIAWFCTSSQRWRPNRIAHYSRYRFGPTCLVCPLAPSPDWTFHYGGRNQNYSVMADWQFASWRITILVLVQVYNFHANVRATSETFQCPQERWKVCFDVAQTFAWK